MALYGEARDISMFRYINRELMHNIISQECVLYKFNLDETKVNVYGEASSNKYYNRPVILYCLIEFSPVEWPSGDQGVNFNFKPTFKFLRDDLYSASLDNPYGANIVPQVGDIIMYQKGYYEIDSTSEYQLFVGKDPDYPYIDANGNNPLENDLADFGYNISVICTAHYVPADRIGLDKQRL
jgi:hypothetical protein